MNVLKKVFQVVILLFSTYLSGAEWELYYSSTATVGVRPNIMFMLDASTSMLDKDVNMNVCFDHFTFESSASCNSNPTRQEYMEYSVNGDGGLFDAILENSKNMINLGVGQFPGGSKSSGGTGGRPRIIKPLTPFSTANLDDYKSSVRDMYINGGSMSTNSGEAMVYYWDHLYKRQEMLDYCKPNVVVMVTDGASSADYAQTLVENSWITTGEFASESYASKMFKYIDDRAMGSGESDPDVVAAYLYNDHISDNNQLCKDNCDETNCPGGKCLGNKIFTYGVSFKNNATKFNLVQNYSQAGGGEAFDVQNKDQIVEVVSEVLDQVFSFIPSSQTAPSVSIEGDYAGNDVYLTSFSPSVKGQWNGNIRKYCVFNSSSGSEDRCLYEPFVSKTSYGAQEADLKSDQEKVTELFTETQLGSLSEDQKNSYGEPLVSVMGVNQRLVEKTQPRDIYYLGDFVSSQELTYECPVEPPASGSTESVLFTSTGGTVEIKDRVFFSTIYTGTSDIDIVSVSDNAANVTVSVDLVLNKYFSSSDITNDKIIVELQYLPSNGSSALTYTLYDEVPPKVSSPQTISINNNYDFGTSFKPEGTWRLNVVNRQDKAHVWINYSTVSDWSLDFSMESTASSICGNSVKEPGECCDGGSLSCSIISSGYSGNVPCNSTCDGYELDSCTKATAGSDSFQKLETITDMGENEKKIYNFINGYRFDVAENTSGICSTTECEKRLNVLGDPMFSAPLIVNDTIVIGTNAGFLEVFSNNSGSGNEVKAIVPTVEMTKRHLAGIYAKSNDKSQLTGVDVTPFRIETQGTDKIFAAYGRGGRGFSIMDTTSVVEFGKTPVLDGSNVDDHNWVYSKPVLVNWGSSDADGNWVGDDYLAVSSGYHGDFDDDTDTPLNTLSSTDIRTGVKWYEAGSFSALMSPSKYFNSLYPVSGSPAFVNANTTERDFNTFAYHNQKRVFADIMYYFDIAGNLYFLKNVNNIESEWINEKILSVKQPVDADNSSDLNVFGRPAVNVRKKLSEHEIWVGGGTGDLTRPTTSVGVSDEQERNLIFSVKHCLGKVCSTGTTDFDSLYNAGAQSHEAPDESDAAILKEYRSKELSDICLDMSADTGCPSENPEGWFFRLPVNNSVVGNVLVYNNRYYVTVFEYDPTTVNEDDECASKIPPGNSYLYEVSAFTGLPVYDHNNRDDRIIKDLGEGKASEPVLVVGSDGNAKIYVSKGNGDLVVIDTEDYLYAMAKYKLLWWKVR